MGKGRDRINRLFDRMQRGTPQPASNIIRFLRHPYALLIRIPLGLLLVIGGLFSFLPVLGIWMLPLGLLLLAIDVPPLRGPVARLSLWIERKWKSWRRRRNGKS